MTRSIVPLDGGRSEILRYSKTLYDKGHGNTVVMHSHGPARSGGPRPLSSSRGRSAPVIAAPTPAPAGGGLQSIIALVSSFDGFSETAPVGMGGQTVTTTIDTGAIFGVITEAPPPIC